MVTYRGPKIPVPDASSVYREHLRTVLKKYDYSELESSLYCPLDEGILTACQEVLAEKQTPHLSTIVDIGIGGSNLGTMAVYDGLKESNSLKTMLFADTVDPIRMHAVERLLATKQPDEVLIVVVSKSGGTTETLANMEVLLKGRDARWYDRVVIITDADSRMEVRAQELGIRTLSLPKLVGGRFSVFSAVGMFPLLAAGIDSAELMRGARDALSKGLSDDSDALDSALFQYTSMNQGSVIADTFLFIPELETVGKWYRQLMGESLGKDNTYTGTYLPQGMMPTVTIGSTDMHSVGQLYFAGPKVRHTEFVSLTHWPYDQVLPSPLLFPLIENIEGKTMSELMEAIYRGVTAAYTKRHLPYVELILDRLDTYNLAYILQHKMLEIMYMGNLMQINTFDQPHVELYKTETKRILAESQNERE